jgi:hypothetical protein
MRNKSNGPIGIQTLARSQDPHSTLTGSHGRHWASSGHALAVPCAYRRRCPRYPPRRAARRGVDVATGDGARHDRGGAALRRRAADASRGMPNRTEALGVERKDAAPPRGAPRAPSVGRRPATQASGESERLSRVLRRRRRVRKEEGRRVAEAKGVSTGNTRLSSLGGTCKSRETRCRSPSPPEMAHIDE